MKKKIAIIAIALAALTCSCEKEQCIVPTTKKDTTVTTQPTTPVQQDICFDCVFTYYVSAGVGMFEKEDHKETKQYCCKDQPSCVEWAQEIKNDNSGYGHYYTSISYLCDERK